MAEEQRKRESETFQAKSVNWRSDILPARTADEREEPSSDLITGRRREEQKKKWPVIHAAKRSLGVYSISGQQEF